MSPEHSSASPCRVEDRRGAYGLEIEGLDAAADWMAPQPAGSPRLRVVAETVSAEDRESVVAADSVDLRLNGGGRLRMTRGEAVAHFSFPVAQTADDLLHPYLAPAAAVAQLWAGREALHAGAFSTGAGALLVLAGKQGGKSTTLAQLAGEPGVSVLADDLAVIADGCVLAGPRSIDLRPPATACVEAGVAAPRARSVRSGDRLRLRLPPAPGAVRVVGIVWLGWGASVGLESVAASARIGELAGQRMFGAWIAGNGDALLDLVALPTVRLTRPRGRAGLVWAAGALLDLLG